jgi:nicotinate-nucleotide adenylyltransferase
MLKACDFEFTLPRPSYTYHTLQALRKAYPDCEFSLIIGEDNWNNFHRWYRGEDIARETPIIIYPREVEGKESSTNSLRPMANGQQSPKLLPYSSTEVRDLIASGHDASHMLHPDVAQYIKERQFYSNLAE